MHIIIWLVKIAGILHGQYKCLHFVPKICVYSSVHSVIQSINHGRTEKVCTGNGFFVFYKAKLFPWFQKRLTSESSSGPVVKLTWGHVSLQTQSKTVPFSAIVEIALTCSTLLCLDTQVSHQTALKLKHWAAWLNFSFLWKIENPKHLINTEMKSNSSSTEIINYLVNF